MALRSYSCDACKFIDVYFDHQVGPCVKCGHTALKPMFKPPMTNKITDKVDAFHNVDAQVGIQEDARIRSKVHIQDTLDEMIAEFGEDVAKEQGWIIWDPTKKVWRKRDNWDVGLLNKFNKGSAEALRKIKK